jgi:diguanylate cyclase (GGDEF)-like protein
MDYPVVDDEVLRLDALRALEIVGAPRTAAFEAIAKLVADTFDCPIGFVSLLDKDRQWFKAEYGLGMSSTPREVAFCNYTILKPDVFVVEDALCDERFAGNPLVISAPGVRFYAGVPITVESGHRIGALCVNDICPRRFSDADKERLRQFGTIVEALVAAHIGSLRVAAAAREVTAKAQLLWKNNKLLRQIERFGKIGGWELDLETNIVNWSDEVFRIHDLPIGIHHPLEETLSFYPGDWRSLVTSSIEKAIATGDPFHFESEFVTALDHRKWIRAAGECECQDGEPVRLFGMFQDITEEKAVSERLCRAANFDELTGLANRHHFNQALAVAVESCRKTGSGLTLMILDLDNFKEINDTRGHAVGDDILTEVGRRLAHAAPHSAFVARLGGDEFAVIISEDCSFKGIEKEGNHVLACLKHPIRIGPTHIYIRGTLGIARFPADAANASELLKHADLGLYSAKQLDRGAARLYSPDLATLFERHSRAVDLVRNALSRDSLVPFYQPKMRLDNGGLYGFEALARIRAEDGSILGPAAFGAALEDRVKARRIGRRMLRAVTADIASWRNAGLDPISVSLNVSEYDFLDGKLAQRVLRRLDELALPHSDLTIEVTESVFLGEKTTLVREALARLDAEGIKIELDDFGTGYASLTHLLKFPISRLKIDRSFIENLGVEDGSRVIVQAVIDLGHKLNCEIIAEGVETEAQAGLLRQMGCDAAQGYFFGHPASEEQTRTTLLPELDGQVQRLRTIAARHSTGDESQSVPKTVTGTSVR